MRDVYLYSAESCSISTTLGVKVKGKASSLDIAPLTILDSGALQPRKWQLTGNDCITAAHAVAAPESALTAYWAHSCSQQAYYAPVNHARSSPRKCQLKTFLYNHAFN